MLLALPPWRSTSLSRWAGTRGGTPALDVDLHLAGGQVGRHAAAGRRRTGRNAYSAADAHSFFVLASLHQAGDDYHRSFVCFDLRHHLLRPVHAQMHAFGNVDASRFVWGSGPGREDIPFGTSGNE